MAFWGAIVASNEPYTLKLDGDHKRLRISQATLEHRKDSFWSKVRSILQCVVGSKPPISICSLSKDFPFCQLDLELEESEQVIFTVNGPQSQLFHLSGYYVCSPAVSSKREASTSTDDLTIDCYGEQDTIMSEKDEERRSIDVGQDNSRDNDYDINDNDHLVNADMHDDVDEKMIKEQLEFLYAFDSIPEEREDEDYVLCIRKSVTTKKKMIEKEGEDSDMVTVPPNSILKAIDCISEETDGVSRLSEQQRDSNLTNFLPVASNEVGLEKGAEPEKISVELFSQGDASHCDTLSSGTAKISSIFNTQLAKIGEAHRLALDCRKQEKDRTEGCGNEKKTVEGDTEYQKSAIKENEVQQALKESDDMCQGYGGNQRGQISSTNVGEKQKETEGREGLKTIETNIDHCGNALEEIKVKQAQTESDDMYQGCVRNQQGSISTRNVEIGDSHPLLPPAEAHDSVVHKHEERLKDGGEEVQPETTIDGIPRNDNGITFFPGENNCPNGSIPPPAEVRCENGQKSKKRKKDQVMDQNYVTVGGETIDHASEKKIFNNDMAETGNVLNVVPAKVEEHKPANDNGDNYADLLVDGCQSNEEYEKRVNKKKIKAKENDNNMYVISSKARTLPNGLIIEDLVTGKSDGKVAAPGRKVKVFYTVRLRETGTLIESNFGQKKPFKFCLGDKKIIEGWNFGIDGMHIGDRRRLVIPPSMGYGKRVLGVIPTNSWLVYEVELVSVR
ncbi:hypothetical protein ACH5RR_012956 [Cinchona calisaya]|uniref:peptidylprolyl isomerase n=1 Tax=Cinchona calisaya TaxID=153742 RepID=A0ABD2ZZY3_9GENT